MSLKQIIVSFLCLVAKPSVVQPAVHPNLYFTGSDVTSLRQQAHTTHRRIFTRLQEAAETIKMNPSLYLPPRDWNKFSAAWNEIYGNNFGALAMYCVINDKDLQAREIAIQIFDAFVSLPNWRVKALIEDDVPVAHSLVAVATAYDFMFHYISEARRLKILRKISNVTKELYERSFTLSWGKQYIQNHVATNYVAFFTGALVVEQYDKAATHWKERAHQMLNRTMFLLSYVKDGSMDEGVAYGSYTSRSLTQYIFLAKRHLGVDLTDNIWLREHFWFIYRTILPGFRETLGIADSERHWTYGPESQLVFLDNFIMRNGYGNWLASKIRQLRMEGIINASISQRYCTLHTEFVFYDPSISEKEPPDATTPKLHVFDDWGVVTYGGGIVDGQCNKESNTFLSFKASMLHGKAINNIVKTKPHTWIKGWKNFNPGHEHPDQGSFVFAPNGVPFITEALYGPKYTWLDNVLLFGPTKIPTCSGNYEGQLGGCGKWLNFKTETTWNARAEVVSSSEAGGMVFISGEISKWYNSYLGLSSVYRAVILLNPGVLLVIDHIEKTPESPTRYVGAVFHNRNKPFRLAKDKFGFRFGVTVLNGDMYLVHWANSNRNENIVQCQTTEFYHGARISRTHFLNITTDLNQSQTRFAYIFAAPGNKVSRPILEEHKYGTHVFTTVNSINYQVSLVTQYQMTQTRRLFLGFDGFAKIRFNGDNEVRFDVDRKAFFVSVNVPRKLQTSSRKPIIAFIVISLLIVIMFVKDAICNLFRTNRLGSKCRGVFLSGILLYLAAVIWLTLYS